MSEPETKAAQRGRGKYWLAGALVLVLAAVGGTWYLVWGGNNDPCAPREPTGVTKPAKKTDDGAGDKWFSVADSGFMPYQRSEHSFGDQGVSFGYLVENPSKYVLYDARLRVRFETSDGYDPTEHVAPGDAKENAAYIDDVKLPVLFPGQRAGLGGMAYTFSGDYTDDDGTYRQPDPVDPGKLNMSVELVSGSWWNVDNDEHEFAELSVSDAESFNTESSEFLFDLDSKKPGDRAEVEYDVDVSSCRKHAAYETTLLAYKDGKIVGGTVSDGLTQSHYGPKSHPTGPSPAIATPTREPDYKAYPYAKPVKPKLTK